MGIHNPPLPLQRRLTSERPMVCKMLWHLFRNKIRCFIWQAYEEAHEGGTGGRLDNRRPSGLHAGTTSRRREERLEFCPHRLKVTWYRRIAATLAPSHMMAGYCATDAGDPQPLNQFELQGSRHTHFGPAVWMHRPL